MSSLWRASVNVMTLVVKKHPDEVEIEKFVELTTRSAALGRYLWRLWSFYPIYG